MGTHLRELSESYPMYTNMAGFRCFSKIMRPCTLNESSLCIARVKRFYCISWGEAVSIELTIVLSRYGVDCAASALGACAASVIGWGGTESGAIGCCGAADLIVTTRGRGCGVRVMAAL